MRKARMRGQLAGRRGGSRRSSQLIMPTNGLVMWLRPGFPGTGTAWNDVTGNGNNGTLSNGAAWSNNEITLDGVNDGVTVADAASLTSNAFTAFAVFKWNGTTGTAGTSTEWMAVMSKGAYNTGEYTILFNRASSTTNSFFNFYINGGLRVTLTLTGVMDTRWHTLAAIYDGTTARLIFDGIQSNSAAYASTISDSSNLLGIGRQGNAGVDYYSWAGVMRDALQYNRALAWSGVTNLHALLLPS